MIADIHEPNIFCPGPIHIISNSKNSTVVVNWTQPAYIENSGVEVNITCIPPSGSIFQPGDTQVVCSGVDVSGNEGSCTTLISVICRYSMFPCLIKLHFAIRVGFNHFLIFLYLPVGILIPLGAIKMRINLFETKLIVFVFKRRLVYCLNSSCLPEQSNYCFIRQWHVYK